MTMRTKKEWWLALVAGIWFLTSLPAAGAIDGEKLNVQTVKITVDFVDGGPSVGSGAVLCQAGTVAYILTARHVIHGPLNGPRKPAKSVTIEFYRNRYPAVTGSLLSFKPQHSQQKDIALLRVDVGNSALEPIVVGRSAEVKALDVVYTTGHSAAKGQDWLAQNGHVNTAGELIIHSAHLEAGYSGGPLVGAEGALIGMNTQVDTAGGTVTVGAIPIDEVLATIKAWVDLANLQRADESSSGGTAAGTREELAAAFRKIEGNTRASSNEYTKWFRDAAVVLQRAKVSAGLRETFDLTKTEVELEMRASGSSFDRESVNYYIEDLLDQWESDEGGAAPPWVPPGNDFPSSLVDQIVGGYSLANYTDLTGSYGPLLVQGQLTITKTGGNAVALSLSTQAPLIGLYVNMGIAGVYDGTNLTGTVTQTNLPNQGAPWAARVSRNGSSMTWNFANGEVWVWTQN